jgi:short-subunit dehydrogenase
MTGVVQTAVVTGASSGIGVAYAEQLARRGYNLILIARRRDRLDALAARLTAETSRKVEVHVADLAKADAVRSVEKLLSEREDIDVLVNNAGLGALGPLAKTALRSFQKRDRGSLINIASVIALGPMPGAAAYSGSKAYVLNFSRSLEMECAGTQISVQTILPGPVHSEFFEQSGINKPMFPEHLYMTADQVVTASLKALDMKEAVSFPALHDFGHWQEFEAARKKFTKSVVSTGIPAPRYADPA